MRCSAVALAASGCATFEDPTIVLDLRIIAMTARAEGADVVERVLDVDLGRTPAIDDVLAQLNADGEQLVCAALADPGRVRAIRWSMTACSLDDNRRCDPAHPRVPLGEGRLDDPETPRRAGSTTATGGVACVRYAYDPALVALLLDILERDPTYGLAGLDYAVELRAGGEDRPSSEDIFGVKQLRVAPRIPATRRPNRNPAMTETQVAVNFGGGFPLAPKHCADPPDFGRFDLEVSAGDVVTLYPVEQDGAREDFVLPTIDGQFEPLTEILSYQWLATAGSFSDDITGGPPDAFGNETLLGTDWTAPDVSAPTQVPLWVIQRDQRYGVSMRELCIGVTP